MAQAASNDPAAGVKTRFVMNLIEKLRHRGGQEEKMLIFCMNLNPLSLLEDMLKTKFGWIREREVLHIDGKVTPDERQSIIERFNDPQGRVRALLLSTKACGEGITLTGASRVIFMDVLWNPAVLRQAIHRAFRLGQTKVVHVYKLVVIGKFFQEFLQYLILILAKKLCQF
jgi:DNA repair and recombination RAD54-like protein